MKKKTDLLTFISKNWFLLGIFCALFLGYYFSSFGALLNRRSVTSTVLVIVIFFNIGFSLPTEKIVKGIKNIRLHSYVQCFIFCIVPLYFFGAVFLFKSILSPEVRTGIFALSCLPTTVSSCIVFTQNAKGNVAGTMFNAAFSNIIGIFLSPLILSLLLRSGDAVVMETSEISRILTGLSIKMLLPLAAGQCIRRFRTAYAEGHKQLFSRINNGAILLIIFFAFSRAASNANFLSLLASLPLPFLFLAVSHIVLLGAAYFSSGILRFPKNDRISVIFAAPEKTLAMGLPLMTAYFINQPEILGIGILPLIFYHSWQLLCAGILIRLLDRKAMSH